MASAVEKSSSKGWRSRTHLRISNLSWYTRLRDLESLVQKFGDVEEISLVPRIGDTFAIIEFRDERSAKEAIFELDSCLFLGKPIQVEFLGREKNASRSPVTRVKRSRSRSKSRSRPAVTRKHSITISRLPSFTIWQELKDHVRDVGKFRGTCHVDIFTKEVTIARVDFMCYEGELKEIIERLDGSMFRNSRGLFGNLTVELDSASSKPPLRLESRSRSRPRGQSQSSSRNGNLTSRSRSRGRNLKPIEIITTK